MNGTDAGASSEVTGPGERGRSAVICALLVVAVFCVFGRTLWHGFVNYDDPVYVYANPEIVNGLSWSGIGWAFTHAHGGNWHPLTTILHMAECQFFGLRAGWHHLVSVALHAAATALLFLALRELTGAQWRSAFVAAVFAVHPLRAESVAWAAELKDVLSGVFFMLTLRAYARYARGPGVARGMVVALWFVLGLMSKPMLVTTPFVLLLLDYWPLGRMKSRRKLPDLLKEKWLLFVLSAGSCAVTLFVQREAILPGERFPLSARVGNALVSYMVYPLKMIWPSRLAVFYPIYRNGSPAWEVAVALMFLGALTAGAWVWRRERPYLITGWLWYLGMLVPVIGIVQAGLQSYADRYTYLPQIGLCFAITWGLADAAGKWRQGEAVLKWAAGLVLCALAALAFRQAGYWRDARTLWIHALACTNDNIVALYNMGSDCDDHGRYDEAINWYAQAMRIDLSYADAKNNLGNDLARIGRVDEALGLLEETVRREPDYLRARNNLGTVLFEHGRRDEGMAQFREALRIDPDDEEAHNNLGLALTQTGRPDEAVPELREALRIRPDYAEAAFNLGIAELQLGRAEEGIGYFRKALSIQPGYTEAHNNLGVALMRVGKNDEAMAEWEEAVRGNATNVDAYNNLGSAMLQRGRIGEAIHYTEKALSLQPGNVTIQNNLAWLLATAPEESVRDGARALELAVRANQETGGKNPNVLRTLAAAYAQTGDFSNAVRAARSALQAAAAMGNAGFTNAVQREEKLYESGHRHDGAQ